MASNENSWWNSLVKTAKEKVSILLLKILNFLIIITQTNSH